jgi:hypothetical protein
VICDTPKIQKQPKEDNNVAASSLREVRNGECWRGMQRGHRRIFFVRSLREFRKRPHVSHMSPESRTQGLRETFLQPMP